MFYPRMVLSWSIYLSINSKNILSCIIGYYTYQYNIVQFLWSLELISWDCWKWCQTEYQNRAQEYNHAREILSALWENSKKTRVLSPLSLQNTIVLGMCFLHALPDCSRHTRVYFRLFITTAYYLFIFLYGKHVFVMGSLSLWLYTSLRRLFSTLRV